MSDLPLEKVWVKREKRVELIALSISRRSNGRRRCREENASISFQNRVAKHDLMLTVEENTHAYESCDVVMTHAVMSPQCAVKFVDAPGHSDSFGGCGLIL